MSNPGFLDSMSPWVSRSSTPTSAQRTENDMAAPAGLGKQQGSDHRVNYRRRLSLRDYPEDCPPLNVRWFYAVDMPKRKPVGINKPSPDKPTKILPPPKKFAPFTARDSRSIEAAFQKPAEPRDVPLIQESTGDITELAGTPGSTARETTPTALGGCRKNTSVREPNKPVNIEEELVKVPVNEDFLFDVDIDNRELAPTYWLGPVYDVRRATWFYQDGASSRPCDENLAHQLEEGYIKAKPWRYEPPLIPRSSSHSKQRPASMKASENVGKLGATNIKPPRMPSVDDAKNRKKEEPEPISNLPKFQLQTYRLFGAHMNSVVTYQDASVAWILTDDFLSRMSSSMYQRFAGGGHLGGVKVVRGFSGDNPESTRDAKTDYQAPDSRVFEDRGRALQNSKRRSAPPSIDRMINIDVNKAQEPEPESKKSALERRMATIIGSPGADDASIQEEEARKREENEIQGDYQNDDGEDQGREIEHLLLVTHGIGQRLGLRMESLNFIHDVNVLRKTLKSVYEKSADLQALNSEVDKLPKNCRIQVLPVVWRHLLDFPSQRIKRDRHEQDLGDVDDFADEFGYPSLSDINVEGVPAIRNLVEDLFLDILLYQSSYQDRIAGIVQRECNRVYKLFLQRNPQFKGKVSLVGHSMGSLIMFDLLCRQKEAIPYPQRYHSKHGKKRSIQIKPVDDSHQLPLDFDVEDFYCLAKMKSGSPIGLFQMLKGSTIAGRRGPNGINPDVQADSSGDTFFQATASSAAASNELSTSIEISAPRCGQVFNIFHPSDPIAYRIEPLISPAMSALKPQPLPYIKRGIFGAPGAGLTGIGVRVGQSVSGLWSNITTGVASSLLNRSLGLVNDAQFTQTQTRTPLSMGAGTNIGAVVTSGPDALEEEKKKVAPNAAVSLDTEVEHPATLIDTEIETLYSGFQKRRKTIATPLGAAMDEEKAEWQEAEDRAKRLRREEAKVRALNSNGRVDYSIQEGVFDISLIASLASHLSYWADEDVTHFMISQLLSRQRVIRR